MNIILSRGAELIAKPRNVLQRFTIVAVFSPAPPSTFDYEDEANGFSSDALVRDMTREVPPLV